MYVKFAQAAAAALVLAGCQGISFDSNLNPNRIVEYYKPSTVETLSDEDLENASYQSLGQVIGLSCQINPEDFIANETDARNDARLKAVDLGANGIVFKKCIRTEETLACHESVTCYAEAISLKADEQ